MVTTKGRLTHLRQTLPGVLSNLSGPICLVDYGCPQGSGDWIAATYPEELERGRILLVRATEQGIDTRFFNRAKANNLGARVCKEGGAESLLFLDADTVVTEPLAPQLKRIEKGSFWISARAPDGNGVPSLTGVLGVSVADFESVGGFDEWFECWGSEDIDLRVRLFFRGACQFREFPFGALHALPHSNMLRTLYYKEKNVRRGARRNHARVTSWVRSWTGGDLKPWEQELRHLWFLE